MPEVRHYIGVTGVGLRACMTMTATEDDGRIHDNPGRHPWDPAGDPDNPDAVTYYRVSEAVAEAFMADDEEDEERAPVEPSNERLRAG